MLSGRIDKTIKGRLQMLKDKMVLGLSLVVGLLLSGCMTAAQHQQALHSAQERKMTVGIVQKEIRKGMAGAEVAEILGSPNIVTTDEQGREVWVYDKISTDVSYSRSSGGGIIGLLFGVVGGSGGIGGMPGASFDKSAGAESKTQRTLTVVIKFDKEMKVRDFAYHSSSF
jgi:outer membrane protein assembly factor BamE (lipoprotein component of BamABCDE complex)